VPEVALRPATLDDLHWLERWDARVTAVIIDPLASNTRAHRFYARLGFRPVGRQTFGADDCRRYQPSRSTTTSSSISTASASSSRTSHPHTRPATWP